MKPIVAIIIQARMGSTRLPGKVMMDIAGKPLLWHVIQRARAVKTSSIVIIATTTESQDQAIVDLAFRENIPIFRGSSDDVLSRYYEAARLHKADVIVRITADCPLFDPRITDDVITKYLKGQHDYVSNTIPPTFPDGLDTEVFSFAALERAWSDAQLWSERENVTPYFYQHPEIFRLGHITCTEDLSSLRWCVDDNRDLAFVRAVYEQLQKNDRIFGIKETLELVRQHPEISDKNKGIMRNEGYSNSVNQDRKLDKTAFEKDTGQRLYSRAKSRIPGGTQLLSKRPEQFLPKIWPSYYSQASGANIWDLDGNRYIDMSYMGIGACTLGYADPDVDRAVKSAIDFGTMSTLNCPEEVELADLLCDLHPWAEMVRYARGGGEAMAVAIRIARASTRRDKVIICGYHGWHDWYLAANLGETDVLDGHLLPGLEPAGVPRSLNNTAFTFHYNKIDELKAAISKHGGNIAAIVMEPVRNYQPNPGFLEEVREIATALKAVLVFDEVSSGWRLTNGGAHLLYKVKPDIAVFAKGMSNGYPMAAIIGNSRIMQAAQDTFISSSYWTERIGPTAALATIRKYRSVDAASHMDRAGKDIQDGWRTMAERHKLKLVISGIPPLSHFSFDYFNGQAMRTLFTQEMLKRGFLATNAFYASYAHQPHHIQSYLGAVDEVFMLIAKALDVHGVENLLEGPVAHSGFARLT